MFGPRQTVPYLERWNDVLKERAAQQGGQSVVPPPSAVTTYKRDALTHLPDTLLLQLKRFQCVVVVGGMVVVCWC